MKYIVFDITAVVSRDTAFIANCFSYEDGNDFIPLRTLI